MALHPYAHTTYDGFTVNRRTKAILTVAADRLGYDDGLTLFQGSYNPGGVGASGGTHDGGGAADLSPFEWRRKVRVLRDLGGAAWHRPELPGVWGEHVHVVFAGDRQLSPEARGQVAQYEAHTDGLAGHGPDLFAHHPDLVPFNYTAYVQSRRKRLRTIRGLAAEVKKLTSRRRLIGRRIARKRARRHRLRGTL